jgi:hypothetical protein
MKLLFDVTALKISNYKDYKDLSFESDSVLPITQLKEHLQIFWPVFFLNGYT